MRRAAQALHRNALQAALAQRAWQLQRRIADMVHVETLCSLMNCEVDFYRSEPGHTMAPGRFSVRRDLQASFRRNAYEIALLFDTGCVCSSRRMQQE
jgi:hypothetical protein